MNTLTLSADKKDNQYFILTFDYRPHLVEAIRKIPGRKFDPKTKNWVIRADHVSAKYVEIFSKYYAFDISADAMQLIEELQKPASEEGMPKLKMELYNFQKLGVSFATKYERCLIADDMGLGKTIESIASVEKLNAYPCLVVCPASLKLNWQKEIYQWIDKKVKIIEGLADEENVPDYSGADFVIINYDIVARTKNSKKDDDDEEEEELKTKCHRDYLMEYPFKSIIFDESTMIKNYKSARTKAIKKIAKNIRYRFALTGTPILNRPKELMPQLDALDRLDSFGGFWSFAKRYCGAIQTEFGWDFSNASNLDELNEKLKEICMIRRLKEDVLMELPSKQRTFIPIEIDNSDEYKMAEKDFIKWVKKKLINPDEYKAQVNKMKNLTASQKRILVESLINQRLNKTRSAQAIVKVEYLKQIVARGKLVKFFEFIDNALEQGIKLVVFANHKEIQNAIYQRYKGMNCARIFAEDNIRIRDNNVEKFQKDDTCRLMVSSLRAGGMGLTLTASSTVIFIEFDWTPGIHDQAEDRCHRIGQKDSVNCYYLYAKNTIDEYIIALIEKKRNIANSAIDGKEQDYIKSDLEEIIKKFI